MSIYHRVISYVVFEDGLNNIVERRAFYNSSFTLSEIRAWIENKYKKKIKKIVWIRKYD